MITADDIKASVLGYWRYVRQTLHERIRELEGRLSIYEQS